MATEQQIKQLADQYFSRFNVDSDVAVASLIASGSVPDGGQMVKIKGVERPLWHRRNYAALGQTKLDFFDEAYAEGVTNLEQPNEVPNGIVFGLEAVGITFVTGYDRDGTGTAEHFADDSADGLDTIDQVIKAMHLGRLEIYSGDDLLFEMPGLDKLPSGGGIDIAAAAGSGATTVALGGAYGNNGVAVWNNVRRVSKRQILLAGGQNLRAKLVWPVACPLTATGFIELMLHGTRYSK